MSCCFVQDIVNLLRPCTYANCVHVPSGVSAGERERDGEAERETEICLVRETSCYSVEMTHSSVR